MSDLPPLAWVALCAIIVMVVVMNLALIALVRNRANLKGTPRPSRSAQSWQRMGNVINVLRDPFAEERQQLKELSERIHELEDQKPDLDDQA